MKTNLHQNTGNTSLYLYRIRQIQPELVLNDINIINEGVMNVVIIVNNEIVFRFPRNEWAKDRLSIEYNILKVIKDVLKAPIPTPIYCSDDVITYRMIPGRAIQQNDLLNNDLVVRQLGELLTDLHSFSMQVIQKAGIPATYTTLTSEQWIEFYEDVQRELFPFLMDSAKFWINEHFKCLLDNTLSLDYNPTFIHGSIRPSHIIFDPNIKYISGIIDFGTAGIGDPAEDIAGILNAIGETNFQKMHSFYCCTQDLLQRARFIAGTFELRWLLQGVRTNDLFWYMRHIGRARDIWPIFHKD